MSAATDPGPGDTGLDPDRRGSLSRRRVPVRGKIPSSPVLRQPVASTTLAQIDLRSTARRPARPCASRQPGVAAQALRAILIRTVARSALQPRERPLCIRFTPISPSDQPPSAISEKQKIRQSR